MLDRNSAFTNLLDTCPESAHDKTLDEIGSTFTNSTTAPKMREYLPSRSDTLAATVKILTVAFVFWTAAPLSAGPPTETADNHNGFAASPIAAPLAQPEINRDLHDGGKIGNRPR